MTATVSQGEWRAARVAFLEQEKDFTHQRDALSAARRALPRYAVTKEYRFQGPEGMVTLPDLFGDRTQLALQHFMFGPDWDEGCPSCSFWVDNLDRIGPHLAHRDAAHVCVARAPLDKLQAYWARLGWSVPVYSSLDSDFNFDFEVSFGAEELETGTQTYNYRKGGFGGPEAPGFSFFQREGEKVFHTYSTFARGLDMLNGAYHLMDMLPKGRDEEALPFSMAWLRRRDAYGD